MDWRNRKYFLVTFDHYTRPLRLTNLRRADPSVKYQPPYNHLTNRYGQANKNLPRDYDGAHSDVTGLKFPSAMLSCSKDRADAIRYELRKMDIEDRRSGFFELNPFDCGQ